MPEHDMELQAKVFERADLQAQRARLPSAGTDDDDLKAKLRKIEQEIAQLEDGKGCGR